MTTPDWFVRGTPVLNVFNRSSDAEFFLDSDFEENYGCQLSRLIWKECTVPVTAFGLTATSLDAHLARLRGVDRRHEEERLCNIRSWVATKDQVSDALKESPLLLTLRNGQVKLEDGWHRLGIAVFEHNLSEATVLCAALD